MALTILSRHTGDVHDLQDGFGDRLRHPELAQGGEEKVVQLTGPRQAPALCSASIGGTNRI